MGIDLVRCVRIFSSNARRGHRFLFEHVGFRYLVDRTHLPAATTGRSPLRSAITSPLISLLRRADGFQRRGASGQAREDLSASQKKFCCKGLDSSDAEKSKIRDPGRVRRYRSPALLTGGSFAPQTKIAVVYVIAMPSET